MNLFRALLEREPAWFFALLWMSLQAAILTAIVFIALKLLGRWIPPTWRVMLWCVVLLRALIPFSPPSPFSLENLYVKRPQPIQAAPIVHTQTAIIDVPNNAITEPIPTIPVVPQPRPSTFRILTPIWIAGLAFSFAALAIRYAIIRRHLLQNREPVADRVAGELADCKTTMRTFYPLQISVSDQIAAPALTGLFPARLIVPSHFAKDNFTDQQVRHVLMHELAHLRLGHLFLHWLTLIARALHWFNPLIHFAAARLREECELAADAAALKGAKDEDRRAYAETILKVLSQTVAPSSRLALSMAEQARHLEKRLRAVTTPSRRSFGLLGALLLATLTAGGLSGADSKTPNQPEKPTLNEIQKDQAATSLSNSAPAFAPARPRNKAIVRAIRGGAAEVTVDGKNWKPARVGQPLGEHSTLRTDPDAAVGRSAAELSSAENKFRANPTNLNFGFDLASAYLSMSRTNDAFKVFQQMIDHPNVPKETILSVANAFSQLGNMHALESSLAKLVRIMPESPEAWFDLSRAQSVILKFPEAILSLSNAIQLSEARLATSPTSKNLKRQALMDVSFGELRNDAEFQKLTSSTQEPTVKAERQGDLAEVKASLYTRTYRLDPKIFPGKIRERGFFAFGGTNSAQSYTGTPAATGEQLHKNIRDFFTAAGVDLTSNGEFGNSAQTTQKALFYQENTGVLFVRAPLSDLDKIENALHSINREAAQMSFDVRIFEFDAATQWNFFKDLKPSREIVTTNEYLFVLPKGEVGTQARVNDAKELVKKLNVPVNSMIATSPSREYTVTNERAKQLEEGLGHLSLAALGVEKLSLPSLTTAEGRLSIISRQDTMTVITENAVVKDDRVTDGTIRFEYGTMVWLKPELVTEKEMTFKVTYNFPQFLGYAKETEKPLPRFRIRSTELITSIPHGHTQIIVVPPHAAKAPMPDDRCYVLFLTPTVIDGRGVAVFK